MNVTVEARHMDITKALREHAEEKVAKLPRFYDGVQSVEVILDYEAGQPKVEIIVQATRKATFVAHERTEDMYVAIDDCIDKLTVQLRRHKDKIKDHHGLRHEEATGRE